MILLCVSSGEYIRDKKKLNKKILGDIVRKVEQQEKFFNKKSFLDTFSYSEEIIGREKQAEELITHLHGYKKGFALPLVSVYGRSGSGKSTIVRYVCENIGISSCIVNLRTVKTIFGSANLILGELGEPNLKSAQGMNIAISKIEEAIVSKLTREGKNFLVMVLDEFDVLFYDKREKPSDFVYKLLVLEERLKKKGLMMTIICISNNALADYELDDRVRSRIGSSEVFFEPYSKEDIVKILSERIKKALVDKVDKPVVEYCAEISSLGHGDARRTIDLLRISAEIATKKGEKISKSHVDMALNELQNERIVKILSTATYHFKLVCVCLARASYLTGEVWHSTSTIYRQYGKILDSDTKPLTYRSISMLLTEIENMGITVSQTASKGRYGYGKRYRLVISPGIIGRIINQKFWKTIVENKIKHKKELEKIRAQNIPGNDLVAWSKHASEIGWKEYVGV